MCVKQFFILLQHKFSWFVLRYTLKRIISRSVLKFNIVSFRFHNICSSFCIVQDRLFILCMKWWFCIVHRDAGTYSIYLCIFLPSCTNRNYTKWSQPIEGRIKNEELTFDYLDEYTLNVCATSGHQSVFFLFCFEPIVLRKANHFHRPCFLFNVQIIKNNSISFRWQLRALRF